MRNSKNQFSVYRLTVLALMIALVQTSRLVFSFLPNVQPVTTILILMTITFGVVDAIIVGCGSIIVSNLFLGMGPWTLSQVVAFTIIILVSYAFSLCIKKLDGDFIYWVIFSGVTGILFGFIISVIQALMYQMVFPAFIGYWIAGIWFDVYHAIGNSVFMVLLYTPLIPMFNKINRKIKKSPS
ncbi:ECF transporter S component [Marinilactibacillus sp. Marseille-P9653]|uniref:ECF transporter S component n=1 Tax=Marinilactibacillus sp. Marseille-P9653 TaxID=2866583 RepID=UPI001CE404F9|nr:ECF transporter S component [Marinilactibacillus sp. Marseille-P9653]